MNKTNFIEEFITKEKNISPSKNLENKIIDKINNLNTINKYELNKISLWQSIIVAASIVIVVMAGVVIGNNYSPKQSEYTGIIINDSQIEQFTIYTNNENE